jgi:phage gp45-like
MFHGIKNLIKQCMVRSASADDKAFPILSVSYHEKAADVAHLTPYGVYSNPPANAIGVAFTIEGEEGNRWAIVNTPKTRPKGLAEGEVVVSNTLTGSKVYFKSDGSVFIDAKKDLSITVAGNSTINVTGNCTLTAGGTVEVTAALIKLLADSILLGSGSGSGASFMTLFTQLKAYIDGHVHSGVQTGTGNTGAPTTTLSSSAATTVVKAQ